MMCITTLPTFNTSSRHILQKRPPENCHETVNKIFEFIVTQVEDRLGYTFLKKPLTSAAHKENGEPSNGLLQSVADADMKIRIAQIPQPMPNELIAVPKMHQWQVI